MTAATQLSVTGSTVGSTIDDEESRVGCTVLSLIGVMAASGISAKGGEGGVVDEVGRLELLSSPTQSNVTSSSTASATSVTLLMSVSELLIDIPERSLAIAKQLSTNWSMFSAASAAESIAAAIER